MEAFGELVPNEPADDIPNQRRNSPAKYEAEVEKKTSAPSSMRKFPPGVRATSNFAEIYYSKEKISWVIDGLLPERGLMYIGARSGTGKTVLALQILVDLIFNRDTMTLKRGSDLSDQKVLVLSLEMPKPELTLRLISMYPNATEEEIKLLADRVEFYHLSNAFELWKPEHVVDLIRLIGYHHATGVIIDSASVSFAQSLKDDTQVNDTIQHLYAIRNQMNVWMIVVSHTRKLPAGIVGSMEDVTVDELFGHSGVAQSASSVLLMHHDKKGQAKDGESKKTGAKLVYILNPKSRFASEFPPFKAYLPEGPPILFYRQKPIELPKLTPEQRASANKKARETSFGAVFEAFDFGSVPGEDDD